MNYFVSKYNNTKMLQVKKKGDEDEKKLKRRMTSPMDSVFFLLMGFDVCGF